MTTRSIGSGSPARSGKAALKPPRRGHRIRRDSGHQHFSPQAAVLDLRMPGDGLECLRRLIDEHPGHPRRHAHRLWQHRHRHRSRACRSHRLPHETGRRRADPRRPVRLRSTRRKAKSISHHRSNVSNGSTSSASSTTTAETSAARPKRWGCTGARSSGKLQKYPPNHYWRFNSSNFPACDRSACSRRL